MGLHAGVFTEVHGHADTGIDGSTAAGQPFERYSDFRMCIKDDAAYVDPVRPMRTTADREERFPLSKLRKDQLDALYRIMEKQYQNGGKNDE